MKVILDTNFLMIPGQFRVDIFGEIKRLLPVKYDLFVPDKVVGELRAIIKKGGLRERKAARIALQFADEMKTLKSKGVNPDEAILSLVDEHTIVCTNDRDLRKKIRDIGGRSIFLRQKRFLEMEGGSVGVS